MATTCITLHDVPDEDVLKQIKNPKDEPKQYYYSDQIRLSHEVLDRMRFMLKKYQGKRLEDFTEFDYQIYTSKSKTLENQTRRRIEHQLSECIPAEFYNKPTRELLDYSEKRVNQYITSKNYDSRHKELLEEASKKPNKLFLIIADEAHWGITAERPKTDKVIKSNASKKSARDKYIDTWTSTEHKNVFILLVSATPYNLMTEETLLPLEQCCARHGMTGELITVEPVTDKHSNSVRLLDEDKKDVTNEVGPLKRVHHVRWTEILTSKLQQTEGKQSKINRDDGNDEFTIQVIIKSLANKSTSSYKDPIYLRPARRSSSDVVPFIGVQSISHSEDDAILTLQGQGGRVRLFDSQHRLLTMRYVQGKSVHEVGFMEADIIEEDDSMICDFEISMEFGEDVFCLIPLVPTCKYKLSLYYNTSTCKVQVHHKPKPLTVGTYSVLTRLPARDLFFLYKATTMRADEEEVNKPRYLSLNFYHTTMWNKNPQDRLIRYDESFENLCNFMANLGDTEIHAQDDLLIAEYSIFIIALVTYNELEVPDNVLEDMDTFLVDVDSYTERISDQLNSMMDDLPVLSELGASKISKSAFSEVLSYLQGKTDESHTTGPEDVWEKLFRAFLLGDHETVKQLLKNRRKLRQMAPSPDIMKLKKQSIAESYETAKIVQGLVVFDCEKISGKMQVIRVRKQDRKRDIDFGKRWYETLTLARDIACEDMMHLFEVLKDFANSKLSDIYSKKIPEKYKTRLLIQKARCSECVQIGRNCDDYIPKQNYDENVDLAPDARCKNCSHYHNSLKSLEDLDKMPCILILVEKGKMGDTFPPSFHCLDLRVRCPERIRTEADAGREAELVLSTMVQGLGRLCRYSEETDLSRLPYALVSKKIVEDLKICEKDSLDGCGTIYSSFLVKGKIDAYIRGSGTLNANNKSVYSNNQSRKEHNRILLDAEPQCGKTGTFCHVISQLRKIIYKQLEDGEISDEEVEDSIYSEDSGESSDEENSVEVEGVPLRQEDDEDKWTYPHWKNMTSQKMKIKINKNNKYTAIFGHWRPGKTATTLPEINSFYGNKVKKTKQKTTSQDQNDTELIYRAVSYSHQSCNKCLTDCMSTVYPNLYLDMVGPYKLSVPHLKRYSFVREKVLPWLQDITTIRESVDDRSSLHGNDLQTWIFVPSHRRAKTGCFNLYHTMRGPRSEADLTEVTKSYIQIIVVQPQEFEEYYAAWGRKVAILQLPPTMIDDNDEETICSDRGIGYSRRFILKFAAYHSLSRIFMLDDNVHFVKEAQFENGKVSRVLQKEVKFQEIPLYKVLKHLENQFEKNVKPPALRFEPYPGLRPYSIEAFCGPHSKYAVMGVRKDRRTAKNVINPFAKVHVHSLILLNVEAINDASIQFQPWVAFEDLDFNYKCHSKNLWVVKYNRFILHKKRMPSNPLAFIWDDVTRLMSCKRREIVEPKEEVDRLKLWISKCMPPMAKYRICNQAESNILNIEVPDSLTELFKEVNKIQNGDSVHFICLSRQSQVVTPFDMKESLKEHLMKTPGIGGFDFHIIALSCKMCLNLSLVRIEDFRNVCDECFQDGFLLRLATSHKVDEFQVRIVLIVVKGKILNPVDRERRRTPVPASMKQWHSSDFKQNHSHIEQETKRNPQTNWQAVKENLPKSAAKTSISDTDSQTSQPPQKSNSDITDPTRDPPEKTMGSGIAEPQAQTSELSQESNSGGVINPQVPEETNNSSVVELSQAQGESTDESVTNPQSQTPEALEEMDRNEVTDLTPDSLEKAIGNGIKDPQSQISQLPQKSNNSSILDPQTQALEESSNDSVTVRQPKTSQLSQEANSGSIIDSQSPTSNTLVEIDSNEIIDLTPDPPEEAIGYGYIQHPQTSQIPLKTNYGTVTDSKTPVSQLPQESNSDGCIEPQSQMSHIPQGSDITDIIDLTPDPLEEATGYGYTNPQPQASDIPLETNYGTVTHSESQISQLPQNPCDDSGTNPQVSQESNSIDIIDLTPNSPEESYGSGIDDPQSRTTQVLKESESSDAIDLTQDPPRENDIDDTQTLISEVPEENDRSDIIDLVPETLPQSQISLGIGSSIIHPQSQVSQETNSNGIDDPQSQMSQESEETITETDSQPLVFQGLSQIDNNDIIDLTPDSPETSGSAMHDPHSLTSQQPEESNNTDDPQPQMSQVSVESNSNVTDPQPQMSQLSSETNGISDLQLKALRRSSTIKLGNNDDDVYKLEDLWVKRRQRKGKRSFLSLEKDMKLRKTDEVVFRESGRWCHKDKLLRTLHKYGIRY